MTGRSVTSTVAAASTNRNARSLDRSRANSASYGESEPARPNSTGRFVFQFGEDFLDVQRHAVAPPADGAPLGEVDSGCRLRIQVIDLFGVRARVR